MSTLSPDWARTRKSLRKSSVSDGVLCIFQFAAMIGLRMGGCRWFLASKRWMGRVSIAECSGGPQDGGYEEVAEKYEQNRFRVEQPGLDEFAV